MSNTTRNGWLAVAAIVSTVLGAVAAGKELNVAPSGTATQSSTYLGAGPEAFLAIDGNTNGDWGGGSISHTDDGDPAPWWQVDLGIVLPLNRIVLWNRTDCCAFRLSNFRVSILDDQGSEVQGDDYFINQTYPITPDFEIVLPVGTEGQVVRLDLLGPNNQGNMYLSLAEVEVFVDSSALPLRISRQPRGGHIQLGDTFEFSVEMVDTDGVTFVWKHGTKVIDGQTSSSYRICSAGAADAGSYTVEATRGADTIASDPAELEVAAGNIALSGTATQSTNGFGSLASHGIDGNVSGDYGAGSMTHTADDDTAPWWELALLGPSTIEKIVLWNRTDCCADRLSNFRVSIFTDARDQTFSQDFFTDGIGFPDTTVHGFEIPVPAGTEGGIVRVEILGPNVNWGAKMYLSLAEVEVIGTGPAAPDDPNIARRRPAKQSSTNGPYVAMLAVDGIPDNFSHTLTNDEPATWEVDLCGAHDIEEIVLHNRKDCCGSRLRDITVSILDPTGTDVLFTSDLLNPLNTLGAYPDGPESLSVKVSQIAGGPVKGGIVRVVRTPDDLLLGTGGQGNSDEGMVLSLSEVEVFKPVSCPAAGDTHCGGLTFDGPVGGGPGDYTFTASATDGSGDPILYTFELSHPAQPLIVIGPQTSNTITLRLGHGPWTATVTVDDSARCTDEAVDMKCTRDVAVGGDPEDLALDGVASQSSTAFGAVAYRAIDGFTDGNFGDGSVTHTDNDDPAPWWQVDLGQVQPLDRIVIWNRTDCCPERLSDFRVSVLDANSAEVYGEDFFTDGTAGPDTTAAGFEVPLPADTSGQVVRIDILGPSLMWSPQMWVSLAEVQVFRAKPTGKTPFHRGDVDGDGAINITDPVVLLEYLYLGGVTPGCMESANADDNDALDINDPVVILSWLFQGGDAPPAPGPVGSPCGVDPAASTSDLGCASYKGCTP